MYYSFLLQRLRSSGRLRARLLAGLLLLQMLAPGLSYALMVDPQGGPALYRCSIQGVQTPIEQESSDGVVQFKCPACLFFGQLAMGATASGNHGNLYCEARFETPAPDETLSPAHLDRSTRPIRAPPV